MRRLRPGSLSGKGCAGALMSVSAIVLASGLGGCSHDNEADSSSPPVVRTTTTTTTGTPAATTTGPGHLEVKTPGTTTTTTTTSGRATGEALRIPVIPKGTTHEFWKSIHAGAIKAQQELQSSGKNVEIIWKGPELENDRNSQVDLVENFVTQKVNGIVLAPLDDQALVKPVEDAQKAGIPVVIIDSGLKTDKYVSFVATDNEKGGVLAGERLATLLGGKGKVLLLRYQEGSASTTAREKGFLSVMQKNPGISLVSQDQYAGPTVDSAFEKSQNLLNRFGSQLNGVFAPNESSARGMLKALEQAGMVAKVKYVGFDASSDLLEALRTRKILGLVVQNPFKMGYVGVKTLVDSLDKKTVQKNIDTGVAMVTPENMDNPDMKELLNPPLQQYLGGQ